MMEDANKIVMMRKMTGKMAMESEKRAHVENSLNVNSDLLQIPETGFDLNLKWRIGTRSVEVHNSDMTQ